MVSFDVPAHGGKETIFGALKVIVVGQMSPVVYTVTSGVL